MTKMDWKKESEGNFPIYPDGTYKVRITDVKRVIGTNTKTPGLQWDSTVLLPLEHAGRNFTCTTWLSEKSLWRVAMLVEACGLTGMPAVDTDSELFLSMCRDCIGRTTFWRNEQGPYKGKTVNNVVDFQNDPDQSMLEFTQENDMPDFVTKG